MTRIFALDSSGKFLNLSILKNNTIEAEIVMDVPLAHSINIMKAVKNIFDLTGKEPRDIDLYACTIGPGSFTGLRIGLAVIKGLSIVNEKPIVGISTLEAMVASFPIYDAIVRVVIPANKKRIYTGLFRVESPSVYYQLEKEKMIEIEELPTLKDKEVLILHDTVKQGGEFFNILERNFDKYFHGGIRASCIGLLALKRFKEGITDDPVSITPRYISASAAEENTGKFVL